MEYIDKRMALEVIEDALGNLSTPENRGMATGLCGAFYMCGLLTQTEWKNFLVRITENYCKIFEVYATWDHNNQKRN